MGTVPVPLDWIANAGVFATAAILEAGVGDPLSFLLNPPGAQVRRTTAQSIPNATPTAIIFDTEDVDTDAMHSVNGTRLTCNTPGTYEVSAMIPYDPNASNVREVRIVKNGVGTAIAGGRIILPGSSVASISVPMPTIEVPMIVGDFIECFASQGSGGALNTTAANGVFPYFRAKWARP